MNPMSQEERQDETQAAPREQPAKPPTRSKGRPRKGDGPVWPVEEVDRLLVFGELVGSEAGGRPTVRYPTYREVAERYGVSREQMDEYALLSQQRTHAAQEAGAFADEIVPLKSTCLLYTSPSPRDLSTSRMPSSA